MAQNANTQRPSMAGQTRMPVRLHRRQTTLDSMPPPVIGPDGFPIFKEPPHADAPDVGVKANLLTRIVHILMCRCTKRYYTAWMCSLGFMITFGIRCNMSYVTLEMEQSSKEQRLHHHSNVTDSRVSGRVFFGIYSLNTSNL